MLRTITILLLASTVCVAQDEPPDASQEQRQSQLRFMREKAEEFTLERVDSEAEPLKLSEQAILRYTNPERERGSSDGVTYLWLDGKRPMAVSSFSIRRPDNSGRCEFTSFCDKPLRSEIENVEVWTLGVPKLRQQRFGGPAPADSAARRMFQMKSLARQFEAAGTHPRTNAETRLRLLERPLYRFADPKKGVIDGGLFAMVVSNDPELLLLIEAVQPEGETEPQWVYSIGQMTSWAQVVKLNGKQVWDSPNYYRAGKPADSPYREASAGKFLEEEADR